MKKLNLFLAALMMSFVFVSCGDSSQEQKQKETIIAFYEAYSGAMLRGTKTESAIKYYGTENLQNQLELDMDADPFLHVQDDIEFNVDDLIITKIDDNTFEVTGIESLNEYPVKLKLKEVDGDWKINEILDPPLM